jgi:hypothetical protein
VVGNVVPENLSMALFDVFTVCLDVNVVGAILMNSETATVGRTDF